MNRLLRVLLSVVIGMATVGGVVFAANQAGMERAAPDYGPPGVRVVTVNSTVITTDTNFAAINGQGYGVVDLFYRIDQVAAALPNTTSLELEVSPDAINWYDSVLSPTILASNAADANNYVGSVPLQGYQFRIVANASNNNAITPVLTVVLR
jgi:hypothetical protein